MQDGKALRVSRELGQTALKRPFEDCAKDAAMKCEISYGRGQNAARLIKNTQEISIHLHVYFKIEIHSSIWNSFHIFEKIRARC